MNSAAFTEAALFIALAVALILFISNFGLAGKAGTFFAAIQFGTFGIFAYIFPVVLVVGTVIMLRKGKNSGVARVKFITAFIGAMFVCAFIEMVGGGYIKLEKLSDYYNFEVPLKEGGGIVGGAVCSFLTPAVGKVGTYIIIIVFIIIAVLIISERSIIRSLTNGSRKVINTAKDDINEYKEESEKKRAIRQEQRELKEEQQRQRRRFDQKVSGVDLSIEIPGTNRRNDILGPKQPEAENMRTSAAGRLSGPDVAEVFQNDRYSENIIEIPMKIRMIVQAAYLIFLSPPIVKGINLPGQRMTVFLQEDMISRKSTMIFMAMTAVLMRMKLIRKLIMMMKPIEKSQLTMNLWMIMPITHRSRLHTGMKVLIQTMLMVSTFRSCLRMTA